MSEAESGETMKNDKIINSSKEEKNGQRSYQFLY